MDPYKVLGIEADASPQEVKRAYLAMAAKYHPDAGGDAWAFEQVRQAYEIIAHGSHHSAGTSDVAREAAGSPAPEKQEVADSFHSIWKGPLPLQSETSWFILLNVLDIILTNILLRMNAVEANPFANYVLVRYGFTGMIAFKLASVAIVCILSQLVATKSMVKGKAILWLGSLIVAAVLLYSCRLIVFQQSSLFQLPE
jgi:hypothetical protein